MKKIILLSLLVVSFLFLASQGCIPETISYHYGANWGANQTFVNPIPTNYYMQHGDMNSFTANDITSSSTIAEFNPVPGTTIINFEKYIKVHRFNLNNVTTQDIKFTYNDINSFAHVPAQVMSTNNTDAGQLLTGSFGELSGLIKQFEMDNSIHHDIHVGFTTPFATPVGTVITKVIESGGFLYAIGYKHVHTGVEIYPFIARIPVGYLTTSTGCQMATGCNDVIIRSFPIRGLGGPPQGFFVDIREMNGEIYFCGSLDDHMVVGRWNTNDGVQYLMPSGVFPSPQSMFNQMTVFNNELYLTYYSRRGPGAGVLVLNPNLVIQRQMSFDPTAYTQLPAIVTTGVRVMPSTIDVIDNQNLLLGGYILDGRIHSFVVNVRHNTPALVNFGFLQKEGHFDVEFRPGLQKSNVNDPNPNYRVFSRVGDVVYLANTTQLLNGSRPDFQGMYITRKSLFELQNQTQLLNGPCDDLPEISLNVVNHQLDAGLPENMVRLDHDVNSFANPVTEIGCVVQVREDYKHWCPEDIQDELDETTCPYALGVIASQTINSVTSDLTPPNEIRLCHGGCINLRADINLVLGNTGSTFTHREYIWLRDNIDMNLPRNQCNIDVCDPDAGTYTLQVLHEESTAICTAQFVVVILPPNVPSILATPSEFICQNQSAVLSISNPQASSYVWTRPLVSTVPISTATTITVNNPPDQYACEVIYANGCAANATIDIYRRDLEISQTISETGSNAETLTITVCNHNSSDANNVTALTNLALPNIMENGAAAAGWASVSGGYEFNIPNIPAATSPINPSCTVITMPVRVNKCPTTNLVQASITDPAFTCPTIISSQAYWPNNGYTPTLAATFNNIPVTRVCNGNPITMTATPGNGTNYTWRENGIIQPYFGNANTQVINYQSLAYFSNIEVDVTRNQCTRRANMTIGFGNTPTNTVVVTDKTCNPGSVAGAVDLTVTPAAIFTYLWSNGATTQDLTNLDPLDPEEDYSVTVTDAVGCQSTQLATVRTLSPINIGMQRRLIGCGTQVEFTAIPTGGTPPYTFEWRFAASNVLAGSGSVHANFGNLILRVTDNAGCARRMLVTPNIIDLSASTSNATLPASYTNAILKLPTNMNVVQPWTLTNCDIKFMGMGDRVTIASPNTNNQAGILFDNSRISTCGNFLARGIVMTQTGDYFYPQNSTLEDMFAAIAIESATSGNFYMPMIGNTFKNNFIGIRINAPNATIVQHTTSSSINPVPLPIINFFSNNTFQGAASIKPFNNASYPTTLIANLETGFNSSNWGSYAGFVGNNTGQFRFSDIPVVGATPSPNYFTNLVNGVLTSGGTRIITNCKFENINPTITGSSSYAHIGYAMYGLGNANTNDKFIINGYNTWSADIQNVKNAIYTKDMHLDMNNLNLDGVQETAIRTVRTSATAVESKMTNNTITARYPINLAARTNDIVQVTNNTINDIPSLQNLGAMISLNSSNLNLANSAQNSITNNTLNLYNSRFGIHLQNVRGNSTTNRYLVDNNRVVVFNPNTGNPTHAHLRFENVQNINITNNIAAEGVGYVKANPAAVNIGSNSTPIGIWTTDAVNSRMSCNNFWTSTGSFQTGLTNDGFEIITNNYLTRNWGMVFNTYRNLTTNPNIPWASNKFYCSFGLNASNYLINLDPGRSITYGNSATVPTTPPLLYTGACPGGATTCPSGANRDFRHYWSLPLTSPDFNPVTVTTNPDPGCTVACPSPPPVAPPQKLAEADKAIVSSLEPNATIYPNPSKGSFRIALEHIDSDIPSIEVEIRDMQGRVVYQNSESKLERRETTIDTQLPAGHYLVRISHGAGLHWMKKLMIE